MATGCIGWPCRRTQRAALALQELGVEPHTFGTADQAAAALRVGRAQLGQQPAAGVAADGVQVGLTQAEAVGGGGGRVAGSGWASWCGLHGAQCRAVRRRLR